MKNKTYLYVGKWDHRSLDAYVIAYRGRNDQVEIVNHNDKSLAERFDFRTEQAGRVYFTEFNKKGRQDDRIIGVYLGDVADNFDDQTNRKIITSIFEAIADYSHHLKTGNVAIPLTSLLIGKLPLTAVYRLARTILEEKGHDGVVFDLYVPDDRKRQSCLKICCHRYDKKDKICQFPAFYRSIEKLTKKLPLSAKLKDFKTELPVDAAGNCLFHSKNDQLKRDHRMNAQFRLLPAALQWARKNNAIDFDLLDFEGFEFAGEVDEYTEEMIGSTDNELINLSDISFPEYVSFKNARFHSHTWLSHCKFLKKAWFDGAKFWDLSDFSDSKFSMNADFIGAHFNRSASFTGTTFLASVNFENADFKEVTSFNGTTFKSYVSFENVHAENLFFINSIMMKDISDSMINFRKIKITNFFKMENVEVTGEVDFGNSSMSSGEIVNTHFSTDRPVKFDFLKLAGTLIIKSLDVSKKVFNHSVSFHIREEDIKGEIVFENSNVFYIRQLEALKELARPGLRKVIFGPGCDKYKLKKEFNLPLSKNWQFLVQEMADSFVAFFNWDTPSTIHIQVECEFNPESVLIRYFADAEIDEDGFNRILREKVPMFATFLRDPQGFINNMKSDQMNESEVLTKIDIFRKMNSLKYAVASRMMLAENFGAEDLIAVFKTLPADPDIKMIVNFNQTINNQTDLFSWNNKKYIASGDINLKQ